MSNDVVTSNINHGAGPWNVLLITDNLVEQKLLLGLLTKHQHQVTIVGNGHEALSCCAQREFEAVILDAMLSAMDAAELTRGIRQLHSGARPPIVVLAEEEADCERCLQAGANACLSRPLQIVEFHDCVRAARQPPSAKDPAEAGPDSVNWRMALEAVGGRRDLLAELIEIFGAEYPATLVAIQAAVDAESAKRLQMSAHQLKGCLRYFGTTAASELANQLENIGRSGQLVGASSMMAPLKLAVERLWAEMRKGPD